MKASRMSCSEHAARMEKNRNAYRIWREARRKETVRKTYAQMEG
jgi:hypothetical protein